MDTWRRERKMCKIQRVFLSLQGNTHKRVTIKLKNIALRLIAASKTPPQNATIHKKRQVDTRYTISKAAKIHANSQLNTNKTNEFEKRGNTKHYEKNFLTKTEKSK